MNGYVVNSRHATDQLSWARALQLPARISAGFLEANYPSTSLFSWPHPVSREAMAVFVRFAGVTSRCSAGNLCAACHRTFRVTRSPLARLGRSKASAVQRATLMRTASCTRFPLWDAKSLRELSSCVVFTVKVGLALIINADC